MCGYRARRRSESSDVTGRQRSRSAADSTRKISQSSLKPDFKTLDLAAEEKAPPRFIVTFSEDKKGFYINGEKFALDAAPMVRAKVGTYQHWKIVNASRELHPCTSIRSIS